MKREPGRRVTLKAARPNRNSFIQKIAFFSLSLILAAFTLTGCSDEKKPAGSYESGLQNIPRQTFSLSGDEGTVINGANGSIFAIPAGAFVDSLGNPVSGNITLLLQEANDMRTILSGDLVTMTGNEVLATDGMYMIDAQKDGQPLKLDPSVGIFAYFPTQSKDKDMRLYAGDFSADKTDWKLLDTREGGIPDCDIPMGKKDCEKCKRLLRMASRIKPGKKPDRENDYWAKRYYWENGTLYFYSSGSSTAILSQDQLDDCKEFLERKKKGRDLLAQVEAIKEQQVDKAGDYYAFRLENLGWYNCDKLAPNTTELFVASVVDEKGQIVKDAKVHLVAKEPDLKIHVHAKSKDGVVSDRFLPKRRFSLYAYHGNRVGKLDIHYFQPGENVGQVRIEPMDAAEMDAFLADLL